MLKWRNVTLGVRHQPENQSRGIANACDVIDAPVGVIGELTVGGRTIRSGVNERNLIVVPKLLPHAVIYRHELAFPMSDRQFHRSQPCRPDALGRSAGQVNPSIDESAAVVIGQGARHPAASRDVARQQVRLHQHLKSVADPDDRLSRRDELGQGIAKMVGQLVRQDLARGDVIAVAEPAGDRQNLRLLEALRRVDQRLQVQRNALSAGQLKCMGGLDIAIGPSRAKDQGLRAHHVWSV